MSIKDRNLKVGTRLIGKYHKQQYTCQVIEARGDKIRYKLEDGREFKSPSAAGMAITGHACDGWHFWSVETAEAATNPSSTERPPETNTARNASSTEDQGCACPGCGNTTASKTFMKTPNQKGVAEGQTRWYCAECGESFLAPYGEIPSACPQGHKA